VARAKQTNRAEARRRYRQTIGEPLLDDATEDSPASAPVVRAATAPQGRPGFGASLRSSYRSPHVGDDLRALPQLLMTIAFLLPAVLIVVSGTAFATLPANSISTLAWEVVVLPGNGFAAAVIAGFLTKRGSYLLGFILGIEQAIVYAITLPIAVNALGQTFDTAAFSSTLIVGAVAGPIGGLLWASGAAWYRRFLAATSARRPPAKPNAKGRAAAKSGGRR
jgi:hypothetical protein